MTGAGLWRCVSASVIGSSHQRVGTVCQDAHDCCVESDSTGSEILLATVADGAGTAKRAEVGALTACTAIRKMASSFLQGNLIRNISRTTVEQWIDNFQQQLSSIALGEGLELRDFACTLLMSIIGPDTAVFFQIGDGAIVIAD